MPELRKMLSILQCHLQSSPVIIDSPLQGLRRREMRSIIASPVLGAAVGSFLAAGVLFARAEDLSSTVSIDNFSFTPKTLTVKAGTTVTWTNRDDIPHGIASSNNAFAKSKPLDTDDSYSFTFTTPGAYQYFCYIHPHMVGSIIVEAPTGGNVSR
jgi:plastocyanin